MTSRQLLQALQARRAALMSLPRVGVLSEFIAPELARVNYRIVRALLIL